MRSTGAFIRLAWLLLAAAAAATAGGSPTGDLSPTTRPPPGDPLQLENGDLKWPDEIQPITDRPDLDLDRTGQPAADQPRQQFETQLHQEHLLQQQQLQLQQLQHQPLQHQPLQHQPPVDPSLPDPALFEAQSIEQKLFEFLTIGPLNLLWGTLPDALPMANVSGECRQALNQTLYSLHEGRQWAFARKFCSASAFRKSSSQD